jgi:predicted protein tyrosine phosphatase
MFERILFVCSCNLNRSPTFESVIRSKVDSSKVVVRSAGTLVGYPYTLNADLLEWADVVFVMDLSHELFIRQHYPEFISKVRVIGISDQYDRDSDDLVELIDYWYMKGGLNG